MQEERELVAHEVGRARRPGLGVGPVEGHDTCPAGEVLSPAVGGAVVEAVTTPEVVGLPGRDAVLDHVGGHGGIVANGERDELFLAAAAHELDEVAAGEPVLRDVQRHGRLPRTTHRAEAVGDRRQLGRRRHEVRLVDQPPAQTLVVAHAVHLGLYRGRSGVDEQRDVVAADRADLAGETFECVVRLHVVTDPIESAPPGVLRNQPRGGRHDHPARQLGVHDRGLRGGPMASGVGGHADPSHPGPAGGCPRQARRRQRPKAAGIRGGSAGGAASNLRAARSRSRRPEGAAARPECSEALSIPEFGEFGAGAATPYDSGVTWARSLPGPLRRPLSRLVRATWGDRR